MRKKRRDHRAPARPAEKKAVARISGFPAVAALFAVAPDRVERLFFDERARSRAAPFCAELARVRKPYRQVTGEELERVAGTILHGGIVAIAQPRSVHDFDSDAARSWARDGKPLLILDGVSNPHNLGAIARTAAFFGLPRIVLSGHPAQALPSDASHRVAEGGFEHLELYRASRLPEALRSLKTSYRIVATALGQHRALEELTRTDKPLALVLGNEEEGLSKATLSACDDIVVIPGAGRIQSLNVAASAAILLHALSGLRQARVNMSANGRG